MQKIISNFSKYVPHFVLASIASLLIYVGIYKEEVSNSFIKFNLDDSTRVHADDPNLYGGYPDGGGGDGGGGGDA